MPMPFFWATVMSLAIVGAAVVVGCKRGPGEITRRQPKAWTKSKFPPLPPPGKGRS